MSDSSDDDFLSLAHESAKSIQPIGAASFNNIRDPIVNIAHLFLFFERNHSPQSSQSQPTPISMG
jgi:hypothetical protein